MRAPFHKQFLSSTGMRVTVLASTLLIFQGFLLTSASPNLSSTLNTLHTTNHTSTAAILGDSIPTQIANLVWPIPTPLIPAPSDGTITSSSFSRTDLGPCICDLTVASCDADCHCDPDCSPEQIALFSSTLPEGPERFSLPVCIDPLLISVNRRGDLITNLAGNLFCVSKHNNPSRGFFFTNPLPGSFPPASLALVKSRAPALADPITLQPTPPGIPSTSLTSYVSGDILRLARRTPSTGAIYTLSSASLVALPFPPFSPFPASGGFRACGDSPLRFLSDPGSGSCFSIASNPVVDCGIDGLLSASRLLSHFSVAKSPGAGIADITSWRKLIIERVQLYDPTMETYNDVYDIASDPAIIADPTLDKTLVDYTFPTPTFDVVGCQCTNVLLSASLRVEYSTAGFLENVFVAAVIGPASAVLDATATCSSDSPVKVRQDWSALHVLATTIPPPLTPPPTPYERLANGMLFQRIRSGNPGYLPHRPILAGSIVTGTGTGGETGDVIQQAYAGLPLLAFSPSRECVSLPSIGVPLVPPTVPGFPLRDVHVARAAFGEVSTATCLHSTDLTQFTAWCSAARSTAPYLELPSSITHLGVWGNSTAQNPRDWVKITADAWPVTGGVVVSDTTTGYSTVCRGLVSAVAVDVYTADYGSHTNPQKAVVAANVKYIAGDVPFQTIDPVAGTGRVILSSSVNFIHYPADGIQEFIPKGPPTVVKLPSDFLYPFYVPTASSVMGVNFMISFFFVSVCAFFAMY